MLRLLLLALIMLLPPASTPALAVQDSPPESATAASGSQTPVTSDNAPTILSVREFFAAGGFIGYVIVLFSILMVAICIDAITGLRRNVFMPPGLAEEVHRCLMEHKAQEARALCRTRPGFLSAILTAGIDELGGGQWPPVEKAREDAAAEHTARVSRRVEYLAVISTLAPMLGLMGTVWGMILAFMEFEQKANPQISELAPGIYKALVTTLQGLAVAIPATGALAYFRRRIDDLAMESTLLAAHVFAEHRRAVQRGARSRQ